MKTIALSNLIQSFLFMICWLALPYRKQFYRRRREPFAVVAIAFALSIAPVALALQAGYLQAFIVAHFNVGSCLLISLLWRPRYVALTTSGVLARLFASYIWPISVVVPIHNFTQRRRLRFVRLRGLH